MKKILFIGMTPNPGGIETYMVNVFSKLQGNGFQFYFLNTFNNYKLAYSSYIINHGGFIFHYPNDRVNFNNRFLFYLTRYYRANKFFKYHHNFDIVHLNALDVNELYWLKAAKKYGVKHLIIQSHNSGGNTFNNKLLNVIKLLLIKYNRIYLINHYDIKKLAASSNCGYWMFGKNSHFQIINNGVDTDIYKYNFSYRNYLRKKLNISLNDKVIITTSRLERQKNYPKIINIFKLINNDLPSSKLIIVGNGSEFRLIKHMVDNYKLNDSVYFLGKKTKNEVSKLLNMADLMIMPSLYEAIPYSLTEAQSSGVPAVVSNRLPEESNITGKVKFLSLFDSDYRWADISEYLLKCNNNKLQMNKDVKYSKFNVNITVNDIKKMYINMMK